MKLLLTAGLSIIGAGAVLVLVAILVGQRLPAEHEATVTRQIAAPMAIVADRIRAVERQPSWRRDLKAVTVRGTAPLRYDEVSRQGTMPYLRTEPEPGRTFVSRIDTDTLPFGGEWTITLDAEGGDRTTVRITERGIVRPPLFRTLSRYVFGHTTTMEHYLDDLATSLSPAPRG